MVVRGNFLLDFEGYKPSPVEINALDGTLTHVDGTPFPTLPGYLPAQDLIPNSERYISGPLGLAHFDNLVPPSVAAFRYGSEAITGVFHSPKGNITLAIFNYPTPQIARDRLTDFQNIPGRDGQAERSPGGGGGEAGRPGYGRTATRASAVPGRYHACRNTSRRAATTSATW